MSIAGIILGVLFTIGYVGCGTVGGVYYVKSRPVKAAGEAFVDNVVHDRAASAQGNCTGNVTKDQIESAYATLQSYGTVQKIVVFPTPAADEGQGARWKDIAAVTFNGSNKSHTLIMTLIKVGDDYKVDSFDIDHAAFTAGPASKAPAPPGQTP